MSNRTLALIVLLIVIVGGLLYLALSPQTQRLPIPPRYVPSAQTASTTLSLTPNPLSFPTSTSSAQVNVSIDSGTNKVTAAQIELSYDPKAITVTDITPSTFFPNPVVFLKTIDNTNGRVSLVLGAQPNAQSIQGTGTVATLTIAQTYSGVKQSGILFVPKTMVTAEGVVSSVLKSTVGTTILFVTPTPGVGYSSPSAH